MNEIAQIREIASQAGISELMTIADSLERKLNPVSTQRARIECIKITSEVFGVDVFAQTKKQQVVFAKRCVSKILSDNGVSHSEIGRLLGRDRTSVFSLISNADQLYITDDDYREKYNQVNARFKAFLTELKHEK